MTSLRELIAEHQPLVVPSVYDAISARLAKQAGFKAAYVGSYATGATKYGLPDIGFIGLQDMADQVRRLGPVAEVPLIVDGEGGWGNPLHVGNAVRVLERAGAAAVHIEDHVFGKHLTENPIVLPIPDMLDKLRAALDARLSDDFVIIARTDAARTGDSAEAVDRALAYQETGVDALIVTAHLDERQQARLRTEAKVPLIKLNGTGSIDPTHGAAVVIHFALSHLVAEAAIRRAFEDLANNTASGTFEVSPGPYAEFDEFLGIDRERQLARRYGLIPDQTQA